MVEHFIIQTGAGDRWLKKVGRVSANMRMQQGRREREGREIWYSVRKRRE